MTPELWLAVGTIVAAIVGLGGVIWGARPRPEPLSQVVKELQSEISRRETEHAKEKVELEGRVKLLEGQVADLQSRLATVTQLERHKSMLMGGVAVLTHYIVANGGMPPWELPEELAPKKPGTGPLNPAKAGA